MKTPDGTAYTRDGRMQMTPGGQLQTLNGYPVLDAGGASATQAAANLDRHWRNIRTISTHNPTHNKASAVGDYLVNGTPPPRNGFF